MGIGVCDSTETEHFDRATEAAGVWMKWEVNRETQISPEWAINESVSFEFHIH